jgi:N-acetylglucosamine kinase-like BadF-type ATPase
MKKASVRRQAAGGRWPGTNAAGIARRALQAIAKASDGRAAETSLSEKAVNYFRVQNVEDVGTAIYAATMTNERIAGFARCVIDAAKERDKVAMNLIEEAGRELGIAATAVVKKLKLQRKKFPVSYVGGIFNAGDLIFKPLLKTIREAAPGAFLESPKYSPAMAAARMAFTYLNGKT